MQDTRNIIQEARKQGQDSLSEYHSKQILTHYGIPTVQEALVRDLDAAREAAEKIGYPVVLKVCSPEVTHKTEKGLI
ncbi:MAG: acetate--CoA ligase family protein, partial [Deltaproteobacteria bacterium]|nr:acetate--CoA ligase family protein [Deltaproteobacteria bacterium]